MRLPLQDRIAALAPRERLFLAVGAAALLLFLLYIMLPGGSDEAEPIELASDPPASSSITTPPPAAPMVAAPPPPPVAPQADPSAAAGLTLRGVTGGGPGGGAIIVADASGAQRVVRMGREILPGMVLQQVGLNHAIASAAGGSVRLELNKSGAVAVAPAAPAAPAMAAAGPTAQPASRQRETLQYRMGLAPQKANGRTNGFALRPGAEMPLLRQAGLQPGDVIVAVNGQSFDSEEKVLELASEIAGSYTAEFEFIRNGKRMKAALQVNQRPAR